MLRHRRLFVMMTDEPFRSLGYPRTNFKEGFVQEYFAGFAHKPATTYGTVNAAVCERFMPGFKSPNACDLIAGSPWSH
jgi:hypothetical protein